MKYGERSWPAAAVALLAAGLVARSAAQPVADAGFESAGRGAPLAVALPAPGRFREENSQTTPVAITAVPGAELAAMGLTNMSEMGRAVPNAYFRQGASAWGRSNQVFINPRRD